MMTLNAALIVGVSNPSVSKADPARDFIVSCSYGVLAGTLVGAATLAFSDKPGENLNKVARGASLGLYAGILLGAYVVYGVPGDDDEAAAILNRASQDSKTSGHVVSLREPKMLFAPVLGEKGIEGVEGRFQVLSF